MQSFRSNYSSHLACYLRVSCRHRDDLHLSRPGHTYKGDSTAAGALLIWVGEGCGDPAHSPPQCAPTNHADELRTVQWIDAYDDGCGGADKPPALSTGAGTVWLDV